MPKPRIRLVPFASCRHVRGNSARDRGQHHAPPGLVSISPKRWRTTTVSQTGDAYPDVAVKRQWDTGALNQVWWAISPT